METSRRIVMIGCGSANLFAAIRLVNNGVDGARIVMVDYGQDPFKRSRKEILCGFAGAGLFSDGKLVFSLHPDALSDKISVNKRKAIHSYIMSVVSKFAPIDDIDMSIPASEANVNSVLPDMKRFSIDMNQSTVWHIGTERNVQFAIAVYEFLKKAGVNFIFNSEVLGIDYKDKVIYGIRSGEIRFHLPYGKLFVGVGKWGRTFINELINSEPRLSIESGNVNIGGRFETAYSDNKKIMDVVDKLQYDFKFVKKYGGITVRTFCVNNSSAYVIEEPIDGVMTYNGHAFGLDSDKNNGMTNFGILARVKNSGSYDADSRILEVFGKWTEFSGTGLYVSGGDIRSLPTTVSGAEEISFDDFARLLKDAGVDVSRELADFIADIVQLLDIKGWRMYVPEMKVSGGIMKLSNTFKSEIDGVYFLGDACTGSVGIVPSALTGIVAADDIS